MPNIQLLVNGKIYEGWTQMGVTRAMDASAGAFTLALTERWEKEDGSGQSTEPWPILPGDACACRIDGQTVISGYVDIFSPQFDENSHTITIEGRDKTADLVDCSAVHSPDSWSNLTLLQFAKIIAKPFGIAVQADADVGAAFPTIKLQQGETAFEAIDRYARQRQVLMMPDGQGGLLLTRAGKKRSATPIVQGVNMLGSSGTIDYSQRFSDYYVKAQAAFSPDTDSTTEAHVAGEVKDPQVKRYRPMLIVAEAGGDTSSATQRANWECNTRIGKSSQARITLYGWRQNGDNGDLWEPNMLVKVRSPWLRMDGDMLIRQVTFERGEQGTLAHLDLVSPQAYADGILGRWKNAKKTKSGGPSVWNEAIGTEER